MAFYFACWLGMEHKIEKKKSIIIKQHFSEYTLFNSFIRGSYIFFYSFECNLFFYELCIELKKPN